MDSRSPKTVALLIESSRSYGRGLLRGIARFARTHGNWSLLHEEMTIDAGLPGWLSGSKVHGVIARVDDHIIGPLETLSVPIVDVRCRQAYPGIPQVETDDRAVSRLVFEHLWQLGFRSFAFCGYKGAHYSENRLSAFREMVDAENCPLSVYETDGQPGASLTSIERTGVLDVEPLSKWLADLPPPTGLFVCNDIRGQQVLNACRGMDITIPDDLGVIGVDDDDAICPLSDPPLSSVQPDAEQVGFRAAEILARMMEGEKPAAVTEYISPL